jgi:mycothiol synthase
LDRAVRDRVTELTARVREYDGVEAVSEAPLLALASGDPGQAHWLAWSGDRLVGYAQREAGGQGAELAVAPDFRRRGVAAGLARPLAEENPGVRVWAHGDLVVARRVAAALGMSPVRELWEMTAVLDTRHSLEADPAALASAATGQDALVREFDLDLGAAALASARAGRSAPIREFNADLGGAATAPATAGQDVFIRQFDPDRDRAAWVALNAAAFADHPEQGRLTLADLDQRLAQPWFDAAGFLVAEVPGGDLAAGGDFAAGGDLAAGGDFAAGIAAKEPSLASSRPPRDSIQPEVGTPQVFEGASALGTRGRAGSGAEQDPAKPGIAGPGLLGYVWTKVDGNVGEIYAIGVHPAAQGQRLGTRLLELGLRHLERRGAAEARLFVEADNAPATAAYRRQGFRVTRRDVQYAL